MNKRLIYQVAVGKPSPLYDWCMGSVKAYCQKHDIDYHVQTEPILRIAPDPKTSNRSREATEKYGGYLPIYEKENAFDEFPEYDQIAIIDADIYIRSEAPNIFEELDPDDDFCGVVERMMPITNQYRRKIAAYSAGQYGPLRDVNWKVTGAGYEFFNMGMMLMNKSIKKHLNGETPEQFIRRPEFKRFVDGLKKWKWSTDQTLLNYWVRKSGMVYRHIDWKWNALFGGVDHRYIKEAHFIHFFLKDRLPGKGNNISSLIKAVEGGSGAERHLHR